MTSTNDNCLGSDCPLYKDCFVVKARKKAMDADVVVVNHHLFLADMVVKESGFAELILEAEVMIFDEAPSAAGYRQSVLWPVALQPPAAGPGERHHHCLPHRTERHSAAAKCVADRLAQSAQDFRLQLGDPGYRGNLRELLADSHIQRAPLLLDDAP
ncbi:hypothetical protein LNQ52_21100 [Klebsiella pneumoniae subsp. pneumoniae]|nr:hypothetical protein [Klebsiella pneumoniae subsp. pneumoniae]